MVEFHAIRFEEARSIQNTLEVRKYFSKLAQAGIFCFDEDDHFHTSLERKNAADPLNNLSLSQNSFFLKNGQLVLTSVQGKVYVIFRFESLHSLHLVISKLLIECSFNFLGSGRVMTKPSKVEDHGQSLIQMRMSVPRGSNSLVVGIGLLAGVPELNVGFSSKGCSMQPTVFPKQSGP